MRPFRARGRGIAGGWNATTGRTGPNQQQSMFHGDATSGMFHEESANFSPLGPPSFMSPGIRPRGATYQTRGGLTQRGRGGASQPKRGTVNQPRGKVSVRGGKPVVNAKPPQPTLEIPKLVKVPAIIPPGLSVREAIALRIDAIEQNVQTLLKLNTVIVTVQKDVQEIMDRLQIGKKRPAPANDAPSKKQKNSLPSPPESCIRAHNFALLSPINSNEGLLIAEGHQPLTITVDDYFSSVGTVNFDSMTSQKVYCEIAHIPFADGSTEESVLVVSSEDEMKELLPSMVTASRLESAQANQSTVDTGCLAEVCEIADKEEENCRILTGKFRGCVARLQLESARQFSKFDIMRCDVQLENSLLRVSNPELVPTMKPNETTNGASEQESSC